MSLPIQSRLDPLFHGREKNERGSTLARTPVCSYSACMPVAITIRNVPDEVRDELAARAARSGRSLQEYLTRQLTDLASRPSMEDVITAARLHARGAGRVVEPAEIISDRDAERR